MILWIQIKRLFFPLLSILILSACIDHPPRMRQDQALDIAWEALCPNTSSNNRNNWEVIDARRVTGREVVSEFVEARFTNCPGPLPPENKAIKASSEYWYIKVIPLPVTPSSKEENLSVISPPPIPEPFISEVIFLIDVFNGQVVARKFTCIIY